MDDQSARAAPKCVLERHEANTGARSAPSVTEIDEAPANAVKIP